MYEQGCFKCFAFRKRYLYSLENFMSLYTSNEMLFNRVSKLSGANTLSSKHFRKGRHTLFICQI